MLTVIFDVHQRCDNWEFYGVLITYEIHMSVMIMRAKFNVNTNFDELEIVLREKSNSGSLRTLRFHFFASRPENIFKLSSIVIYNKFWKLFESVDY